MPVRRSTAAAIALSGLIAAVSIAVVSPATATTTIGYSFDNAGELSDNFTSYVFSGSVSQSASGGLNNSGAINAPGSADAVFASKSSYSLGPVGSSYTFTSWLQSVGNSGYSGMGFTSTSVQSASTASGTPFRPRDGLGVSVHGGGFVFHSGATDYNGSWSFGGGSISTVKLSTTSDLLNSGSPSKWYKVVLVVTRDSSTTFDMRVEVWPSDATGALLRPAEADAIFELRDQTATALTSAAAINTYINFSGDRVRYFDGYSVNLAGGATVVDPGAPVVLSSAVSATGGVMSASGLVTSDGGSAVTERGMVYSTSQNPTTSDSKVADGSGTGSIAVTANVADGTYYVRAFATNANGTSYGAELGLIVASGEGSTFTPTPSPSATPTSTPTPTPTVTPTPTPTPTATPTPTPTPTSTAKPTIKPPSFKASECWRGYLNSRTSKFSCS